MKLNETFLSQTIYGLMKCKGKRLDDDYALIKAWWNKSNQWKYYVIHIESGMAINGYWTMACAKDCYKEDLESGIKKLESQGKRLDDMIQKGIERFNRMKEQNNIHKESDGVRYGK